jgi:hypothetical protein
MVETSSCNLPFGFINPGMMDLEIYGNQLRWIYYNRGAEMLQVNGKGDQDIGVCSFLHFFTLFSLYIEAK